MMFNKILIVTDELTDIHNYDDLVRYLSTTVNLAQDIFFSQGPMDILDHSSSRFAYGSKMGIDATHKFEEEIQSGDVKQLDFIGVSDTIIKKVNAITGIERVNWSLVQKGMPVLIIGSRKSSKNSLSELVDALLFHEELYQMKFLIFVDPELDIDNLEVVSWYVAGNIDPRRDCRIIEPSHEGEEVHFIVNGTRKLFGIDGFNRDWPNPVVSSLETIRYIDQLWPALGIGEFIPSPSLQYLALQKGEGAISSAG